MKIKLWLPLLALLLIQCDRESLEAVFDLEYPNQRFNVPSGLNTIEAHFFIVRAIPTNKDFFFGNFTEEDIVEIAPTFATISIELGGGNFSYVDEMSVLLCEDSFVTDDNIFQKCNREIFFREDIPFNAGRRVNLLPNTVNLKEDLLQDEFTVAFVFQRLRGFSPNSITARLDMAFEARR